MNEGLTSIIIVTADSGPATLECVTRALASDVVVEVLLVDNGSRDEVPQSVARRYRDDARLRVLYNEANLGFGAAANIGVEHAGGDGVLVLNPDCLIEPDTVRQLRALCAAHARAGLVGAVICDQGGVVDPSSRRRDPLLRRALATLRSRSGSAAGGIHVPGPVPQAASEEEAISGALMFLPRTVFERVGGFDAGYFLHCEDLDLCRRVRDAGYRVLLAGQVRVLHAGGGSSRHRPVFVSRHKHAGMWRWFRKFDPAARNPLLAVLVWCGLWAHFLAKIPIQLMARSRMR